MILWLDGALMPAGEARIDPADRGLLLGDGLFETMRAEAGRVLRLGRHLARLRGGAGVLGIPVPYDDEWIERALTETLAANGLARGASRLTLTRGPGPRGLLPPETPAPTLMIAAFELPPPRPPARAIVVPGVRRNAGSPLSRLKALGYLDNILALREARDAGGDEAILLNGEGRLACASAANLFLVSEGQLLTPPVSDGVLPGVTRGRLLELATILGLPCREQSLLPDAFARAEEVFLTSSLALLRPVAAIDGRALACPGPVTERLAKALATDPG